MFIRKDALMTHNHAEIDKISIFSCFFLCNVWLICDYRAHQTFGFFRSTVKNFLWTAPICFVELLVHGNEPSVDVTTSVHQPTTIDINWLERRGFAGVAIENTCDHSQNPSLLRCGCSWFWSGNPGKHRKRRLDEHFQTPNQSDFHDVTTMPTMEFGWKRARLLSINGLCMAHAIKKVRRVRPICICFECADQIVNHEHFNIIKAAFKVAAYTLHWSTVMTMERFGMHRSRWLAVLVRHDVQTRLLSSSMVCDVQMMKLPPDGSCTLNLVLFAVANWFEQITTRGLLFDAVLSCVCGVLPN